MVLEPELDARSGELLPRPAEIGAVEHERDVAEPNVAGLAIFLFEDEHALAGWQSGLYYANAKAKPSLGTIRWAGRKIAHRTFAC